MSKSKIAYDSFKKMGPELMTKAHSDKLIK